jgi:hypothetical protein
VTATLASLPRISTEIDTEPQNLGLWVFKLICSGDKSEIGCSPPVCLDGQVVGGVKRVFVRLSFALDCVTSQIPDRKRASVPLFIEYQLEIGSVTCS